MKRLGSLGLLLLLIQMGRAGEAVQISSQFIFMGGGGSTNGIGFAFRPQVPLRITALRWDFHPNVSGFATGRVEVLNASGQILATVFISTNAVAMGMDYVDIHPPLVMPAGTTNFLRSSVLLDEPIPDIPYLWFGGVAPTNQLTIAPELDYLGSGRGLDLSGYLMDHFHIGGNFRFETIPLVNLQISATSSNHVCLSWPAAAGDYVLHSGPAPDAPMTPVLALPELIGSERVVTVPVQTTDCFFRLVR